MKKKGKKGKEEKEDIWELIEQLDEDQFFKREDFTGMEVKPWVVIVGCILSLLSLLFGGYISYIIIQYF